MTVRASPISYAALAIALTMIGPAAVRAEGPAAAATDQTQSAAAGERVLKLGYDAYIGGMKAFAFDADLAFNGRQYSISGGGASMGFIRWMWKWGVVAEARGTVSGTTVTARHYAVATMRKNKHKHMGLKFNGAGTYSITRTPPDTPHRASKREPPDNLPNGAMDPLTATLSMANRIFHGGKCAGKVPVFDGNRRYDLTFSPLGRERIYVPGYTIFSGEALICTFGMKRISGFRRPRNVVRYWDEDDYEPPRVWVASLVKGMPPVPVKLEVDLNLGGLMIYLVRADHRGRPVLQRNSRPRLKQTIRNRPM
jgi:hypothetical protein